MIKDFKMNKLTECFSIWINFSNRGIRKSRKNEISRGKHQPPCPNHVDNVTLEQNSEGGAAAELVKTYQH